MDFFSRKKVFLNVVFNGKKVGRAKKKILSNPDRPFHNFRACHFVDFHKGRSGTGGFYVLQKRHATNFEAPKL